MIVFENLPTTKSRPLQRNEKTRNGVVTVESLFVLVSLMFLLFSFIDTCLIVYQHNTINVLSKDLSRFASLYGASYTIDESKILGPNTLEGSMVENETLCNVVKKKNRLLNLENMQYRISWPDGDNQPGNSVLVEIHYKASPIIPTSYLVLPEYLNSISNSTIQ